MAEDKGLLASAIETVKAISLNGNGVHGDSGSTASGTPNSEDTNGRESKVEEAETKSKAPAESSEGPQSHRVVSRFLFGIRLLVMSEFRLCPLNNDRSDHANTA